MRPLWDPLPFCCFHRNTSTLVAISQALFSLGTFHMFPNQRDGKWCFVFCPFSTKGYICTEHQTKNCERDAAVQISDQWWFRLRLKITRLVGPFRNFPSNCAIQNAVGAISQVLSSLGNWKRLQWFCNKNLGLHCMVGLSSLPSPLMFLNHGVKLISATAHARTHEHHSSCCSWASWARVAADAQSMRVNLPRRS